MFINPYVGYPVTKLIPLSVAKLSMGMLSGKSFDFFGIGYLVKMIIFDFLRNGATTRGQVPSSRVFCKMIVKESLVSLTLITLTSFIPKGMRKLSIRQITNTLFKPFGEI